MTIREIMLLVAQNHGQCLEELEQEITSFLGENDQQKSISAEEILQGLVQLAIAQEFIARRMM